MQQNIVIGTLAILSLAILSGLGPVAPVPAQSQSHSGQRAEVKITVGQRRMLRKAETRNWFPNIHRMSNGNLIATCQTAPDETNPEADAVARRFVSTDNAETWKDLGPYDTGGPCKLTLRNGTFVNLWFYTVREDDGWVTKVVRSTDNGLTYTTEVNVPVRVEQMREGKKGTGMVFDGGLVEMESGDLLATMYGYFKGDKKYRSILVRSRDEAHSWDYVSTIAYDPAVGREGFCEPAMIRTGPSSLLVTMRTGSGTPMYQCRSSDAGKTWSVPVVIADRGVEPDLVTTDDGVLVCSYGRPNVYVMCSPDGRGENWTNTTLIYEGRSTCYTGMAKIGPNKILLIHDALQHKEPGDEKPYNYVFIVPLTIERSR